MAFGDLRQIVLDTDNVSPNNVAYSSNVLAGSLLVACYTTSSGVDSTITDSRGNTWTTAATSDIAAFNTGLHLAYAYSASAGANTVTFTTDTDANGFIWILEYEGPFSKVPLDPSTNVDAQDLAGSADPDAGTVTTSRPNDLRVGWYLIVSNPSVGSGFTQDLEFDTGGGGFFFIQHALQAAAGSTSYPTVAASGAWAATGASFRAATTLAAAAGSYAYTGTAAVLKASRLITAATGAYAYTGSTARTLAGRFISAASGAYTYTGTAASTLAARLISAAAGVYNYAGVAADLIYSAVPAVTSRWLYNRKKRR